MIKKLYKGEGFSIPYSLKYSGNITFTKEDLAKITEKVKKIYSSNNEWGTIGIQNTSITIKVEKEKK